eukprot:gnl/Dysnectes_brevis/3207_a4009_1120.p1 GENE.gnl/Dysnectes_brevis/3207_a4009_1120~~gnl/Dysnectes_brevis/3207_a4009_1120.p1  ORF type:complete len:1052 (-),score=163.35 gnl/Dysnectes_brevis/3207_a4009_1120:31-3186(-)
MFPSLKKQINSSSGDSEWVSGSVTLSSEFFDLFLQHYIVAHLNTTMFVERTPECTISFAIPSNDEIAHQECADHIIQQFSILKRAYGINFITYEERTGLPSSPGICITVLPHSSARVDVKMTNVSLRSPLPSPFAAKQRLVARRDVLVASRHSPGASHGLAVSAPSSIAYEQFELKCDLCEDKLWGWKGLFDPDASHAQRAVMIMMPMLNRILGGTTASRTLTLRLGVNDKTGEFIFAQRDLRRVEHWRNNVKKLFKLPFMEHSTLGLPLFFNCSPFEHFKTTTKKHASSNMYCVVITATVSPDCSPPLPLAPTRTPPHLMAVVLPTNLPVKTRDQEDPLFPAFSGDPGSRTHPCYLLGSALTVSLRKNPPPLSVSRLRNGANLLVCPEGADYPTSRLVFPDNPLQVSQSGLDTLAARGTVLDMDFASSSSSTGPFVFLDDTVNPPTSLSFQECPVLLGLLTKKRPGATMISELAFESLFEAQQTNQLKEFVTGGSFTLPTMGSLPPCVVRAWPGGSKVTELTYVTYLANRVSGATLSVLSRLCLAQDLTVALWEQISRKDLSSLANELHSWATKRVVNINLVVEQRDHIFVKGIANAITAAESGSGLTIHAIHHCCGTHALPLRFRTTQRVREGLQLLGHAFGMGQEFNYMLDTLMQSPGLTDDHSLLPFLLSIGVGKVRWLQDAKEAISRGGMAGDSVGAAVVACLFSAAPICLSDIKSPNLAEKIRYFLANKNISWVAPLCVSGDAVFAAVDLGLFTDDQRAMYLRKFFGHGGVSDEDKVAVLRAIIHSTGGPLDKVRVRSPKNNMIRSFSSSPWLHANLRDLIIEKSKLLEEWIPSDLINFGRVLDGLDGLGEALEVLSNAFTISTEKMDDYDWYNVSSFTLRIFTKAAERDELIPAINLRIAFNAIAVLMLLPHQEERGERPPPHYKLEPVVSFLSQVIKKERTFAATGSEHSIPDMIQISKWLLGLSVGHCLQKLSGFLPDGLRYYSFYNREDETDFTDFDDLETFGQIRHVWLGMVQGGLWKGSSDFQEMIRSFSKLIACNLFE